MLASQRKQQILQILTEEKQVMSGELSQRFNVSGGLHSPRSARAGGGGKTAAGPWRGIAGFRRHCAN